MDLKQILSSVNDTDELVIGSGVLTNCGKYLRQYWAGDKILIIADSNTWKAAGKQLWSNLETENFIMLQPIIFDVPPILHADYQFVKQITTEAEKQGNCVMISVGSGTINDLVKRAAFENGGSYLCVGTAASMDGYCSSGAALSAEGRKQTMDCPAPRVIIADTDILKTAPPECSSAGYGDLASKLTAGADWIIADFTGDDPIDQAAWDKVQLNLSSWLSSPKKLSASEPRALSAIFEGLNFSGLAMQTLGRSRAASGAEHLLSHIWEMSGHLGLDGNPVSHGFQVSIGILCVTALMEEIFQIEACDIDIDTAVKNYPSWSQRAVDIEKLMGRLPSWEEYLKVCRQKHLKKDELRVKLVGIKKGWEELKIRVWTKLPHYTELKNSLQEAGCPTIPLEINLKRKTALETYAKAQCMRNRYTILDLAFELGVLDDSIKKIKMKSNYL